MSRLILPILLIASSVGLFFVFSNPIFLEIKNLLVEEKAYNEALNNSRQLKEVRDQLLLKYNSFSSNDLARLNRMIPDNVDNIKLIIEIERIAAQYGLTLKGVEFEPSDSMSGSDIAVSSDQNVSTDQVFSTQNPEDFLVQNKDYGVFDLEFTTVGTYSNFMSFLKDLENSLRIVDVDSVTFSSIPKDSEEGVSINNYEFGLKIKTYWLKS